MTKIYTLDQIKEVIQTLDLSGTIEEGFMAYSRGEVVVPPVGELVFDTPPGDTHIKYGYIKNTSFYVIKIASGFYENPELGLPSSSRRQISGPAPISPPWDRTPPKNRNWIQTF